MKASSGGFFQEGSRLRRCYRRDSISPDWPEQEGRGSAEFFEQDLHDWEGADGLLAGDGKDAIVKSNLGQRCLSLWKGHTSIV
jgi:hypothetical protein